MQVFFMYPPAFTSLPNFTKKKDASGNDGTSKTIQDIAHFMPGCMHAAVYVESSQLQGNELGKRFII